MKEQFMRHVFQFLWAISSLLLKCFGKGWRTRCVAQIGRSQCFCASKPLIAARRRNQSPDSSVSWVISSYSLMYFEGGNLLCVSNPLLPPRSCPKTLQAINVPGHGWTISTCVNQVFSPIEQLVAIRTCVLKGYHLLGFFNPLLQPRPRCQGRLGNQCEKTHRTFYLLINISTHFMQWVTICSCVSKQWCLLAQFNPSEQPRLLERLIACMSALKASTLHHIERFEYQWLIPLERLIIT